MASGAKPAEARAKTAPLPASPLPTTHTVRDGETLWTIAGAPGVYGDPLLWPLLYQANRDQIKDPGQVFAGQVLNITRDATVEEKNEVRKKAKASGIFMVKNPVEPFPSRIP